MTSSPVERSAISVALVALVAAAVGAVIFDGELEVTLSMTTAVIAGLLLFDTSMGPRVDSFRPWAILSVAPALKAAPFVWLQIAADQDANVERYEHIGSLLFGACILAAVLPLTSPALSVGAFQRWYDRAAILGASVTAAVAGASVAFLFDSGFGSERSARLIETPTWAVIGALIAASAMAASYPPQPSWSLVGVIVTAAIATALIAYEVAGGSVDVGVWSFAFAGFAASTQLSRPATLGARHDRRRRSNASVLVLIAAGIVAAASAIVARGDRSAWSPGWMVLGVVSLWLFGQAMASRPLTDADRLVTPNVGSVRETGASDRGLDPDDSSLPVVPETVPEIVPSTPPRSPIASQVSLREVRRAAAAKAAALDALASASRERPVLRAVPDASPTATTTASPALVASGDAAQPADDDPAPLGKDTNAAQEAAQDTTADADASRQRFLRRVRDSAEPDAASASTRADNAVVEPGEPAIVPSQTDAVPIGDTAAKELAVQSASTEPAQAPTAAPEPAPKPGRVAAVDRSNGAHAPLERAGEPHGSTTLAHHVDPSTGLLSGAGLQQALASAFAMPVRAGDVAIMMITVRDLDRIEQTHGRLAAAAATSVIAERLRTVLPDGTISRFARSAYAVLLTKAEGAPPIEVERLARALLYLREPLRAGSFEVPIDVVAGMAQCYHGEDAADFVLRANQGLAQAVQTSEPTFVSMP